MSAFELIHFPSDAELASAAANQWLEKLRAAPASKPHCVALSGGRIAKTFFSAVTDAVRASGQSLTDVHFFWADERCVPPDDPESNFLIANENLFKPLSVAAANIHRIKGELSPERAVALATNEFADIAVKSATGESIFDVIFLGLGEDGHTASLFPNEPESLRRDPAIYRVVVSTTKPPPLRVTLGYKPIAIAREVWVLANGKAKATTLRESLSPTGKTPLADVLNSRRSTRIFTDIQIKN